MTSHSKSPGMQFIFFAGTDHLRFSLLILLVVLQENGPSVDLSKYPNIVQDAASIYCRSTPARHTACPYQYERHPIAQNKLKTLILLLILQITL